MKFAIYLSILMALACAAVAVPVDANAPDGIAAVYLGGVGGIPGNEFFFALCTTGEVWVAGASGVGPLNWAQNPSFLRITVPVSTIADWTPYYYVKIDGSRWYHPDGSWAGWMPFATPCSASVDVKTESLGSIKGLYR